MAQTIEAIFASQFNLVVPYRLNGVNSIVKLINVNVSSPMGIMRVLPFVIAVQIAFKG